MLNAFSQRVSVLIPSFLLQARTNTNFNEYDTPHTGGDTMLVPGFERYCRPRTETPGEVGAGLFVFFRTSLIRKTKNNLKNLIFDIDFPLYFIKGNPINPTDPTFNSLCIVTKGLQRELVENFENSNV